MPLVALVLAYLVGSVPTAYLVGRANGIDLRTVGSGNLGATNVFRTLGWKAGLFVYLVDMAKGALPVLLLPRVGGVPGGWPWGVAFGIVAILGHVRPVFLLGKGGGKGIATASGVFLALAPLPFLGAFASFVVTVWISKYVSLGSLIGAVVLTAGMLLQQGGITPLVYVSAAITAFVFWTHRENISRLRSGTERRITRSTEGTA